jgi:hypothetical protein
MRQIGEEVAEVSTMNSMRLEVFQASTVWENG